MILQLLVLLAMCLNTLAILRPGATSDTYSNCIRRPYRTQSGYVALSDQQHDWRCIQRSYQQNAARHNITRRLSDAQLSWAKSLFDPSADDNGNCFPKTVRKEYRVMTDVERATFHAALQGLKSTNVPGSSVNMYDTLAGLHVGNPGAHDGPGFFPWHRCYLIMFERALRNINQDAMLPYWANFWDNEMANPAASIMWDERFMGNGNGAVVCGPAANWPSPTSPLTRNVPGGRLMSQQDVNNVLSQNYLVDIAEPYASVASNLENHHGSVHSYVGGEMGSLNTAAYDPVFFLHHAFIDCLYEEFLLGQIANGINPHPEWPPRWCQLSSHGPNDPINIHGVLPGVTNIEMSSRKYACATYEPTCSRLIRCDCENRCPSKYLTCDRERQICIPIEGRCCGGCSGGNGGDCCSQSSGYAYGGGPNGGGRYTPYGGPDQYSRPNDRYRPPYQGGSSGSGSNTGVQNTYCIDQERCDIDYWAYVPIQINSYRPPNIQSYNSYPIHGGRVDYSYDIYNGRGYSSDSIYHSTATGQSQSPAYANCACRSTGGGVYVETYGDNYEGRYREYQPVDQYRPISSATTYAPIMNPFYSGYRTDEGVAYSRSMVRVYDECGRMCRPRCRYTGSAEYVDCNGNLEVCYEGDNYDGRRTYGPTYEDATRLLYNYEQRDNRYIPSYRPDNVDMIYDCDYRGDYLWPYQGKQDYNDEQCTGGNPTYQPPPRPDPEPYVPNPYGGYY